MRELAAQRGAVKIGRRCCRFLRLVQQSQGTRRHLPKLDFSGSSDEVFTPDTALTKRDQARIISVQIFRIENITMERSCMELPLEANRGRLTYWLFYAGRWVSYAY